MDMVDYSGSVFNKIKGELEGVANKLKIEYTYYIPISAKFGDNVVDASAKMRWYTGETFLRLIETIEIIKDKNSLQARFPVQTIIRPLSTEYHDYRGYAGRVAGGILNTGDEVTILPSFINSRIKSIDLMGKRRSFAGSGDSISITLEDQVDISRGDMIVKTGEIPEVGQEITLMACWFNERPLKPGGRYIVRNNTNESGCQIKSVNYRMNINTFEKDTDDLAVKMNDIANISIRTSKPLFFDNYRKNNITGSLIFIEEGTNETVGAGMIE
jgi:sulfate adenylyltransferase subunit 1